MVNDDNRYHAERVLTRHNIIVKLGIPILSVHTINTWLLGINEYNK